MYVYICICMYVCVYVYICNVCMYLRMYFYVYICMCVYAYVCHLKFGNFSFTKNCINFLPLAATQTS